MSARLVRLLRDLGFEPNAGDVADIYWLAQRLDEPDPPGTGLSGERKQSRTRDEPTGNTDDVASAGTPSRQESRPRANLSPDDPARREQAGAGGLPFRVPAATALPDQLDLARALRPLNRRVPSRVRQVLDEAATVERIAEERVRLPVLKPAPERWLEVALVVEQGGSMAIWRDVVAALRALLERQGAFRRLRTWRLVAEAGVVRLYPGESVTPRPARELVEPSGRRLVLLVSDMVSDGWFDGSLARVLDLWGRYGPLVGVQLLPQRFWPDTALGLGASGLFRVRASEVANWRLRFEPGPALWDADTPAPGEGFALPVVTLEPRALGSWATALAGLSGARMVGFRLPLAGAGHQSGEAAEDDAEPTVEERYAWFQSSASPEARALAGYFAAVPLTLPIMRLVQRAMLRDSRQTHLAEVFLGGLLRKVPLADGQIPDDPEAVRYEFIGDLRGRLLSRVRRGDAFEVLVRVGEYIEPRLRLGPDFGAVLDDVGDRGGPEWNEATRYFAAIAVDVLRWLGGGYRALADRLEVASGIGETASSDMVSQWTELDEHRTVPLETQQDFKFDVTLSHVPENRDIAEELARKLRAEGFRVGTDPAMLNPGSDWDGWKKMIQASQCFVSIITPRALSSEWVEKGWQRVAMIFRTREAENQRLIPILIGVTEPPHQLTGWQVIHFDPEDDRSFQELVARCWEVKFGPTWREFGSLRDDSAGWQTPFIHGWEAIKVQALQQAAASELRIPVSFQNYLRDRSLGPEMLVIPPGRFLMGSPEDEFGRWDDERQHEVTIERPFAIGRYAVTFAEYDRFCKATRREPPSDEGWGRDRRPVINVSWENALAYCWWLSEQTGQEYRLPTEAEWEYACRAGTTTAYWWGPEITPKLANYDVTKDGKTLPVDAFEPNPWGLYQVHGNVWEWTGSDWASDYNGSELILSNNRAGDRVIRGGSWFYTLRNLRAAFRTGGAPDWRLNYLGFRLARTL